MFILPIGFDAPRMERPYATYLLAAGCTVVWVIVQNPFASEWALKLITFSGDVAGYKLRLLSSGVPPNMVDSIASWTERPWNLVTCTFLHAGFFHLVGNMAFLIIFGRAVDGWLGSWKLLICYLLLGCASTMGHIAWTDRLTGLVGASGAISGVMGMATAIFPVQRVKFVWAIFWFRIGLIEVRAFWALVLWFAWDLLKAFILQGGGHVAFMAHVMGFVAGLAVGTGLLAAGWIARHDWDLLEWITGRAKKARMRSTGRWSIIENKVIDLLMAYRSDPAVSLRAVSAYRDLVFNHPAVVLPAYTEKAAIEAARRAGDPEVEVAAAHRFALNYPAHRDAKPLLMAAVRVCADTLHQYDRAEELTRLLKTL